jgi:vesicle transport through interaction with t-SNAREs 1
MEIEIQGIPQSLRPQYQSRIKSSKADLARYKKLSREMHAQASRADLFSRGGGAPATSDEPYGSTDRARLLAGTAVLEDGSRRLQESQRIALETEEQGADILRSLIGQREQIENARNTVRHRVTIASPEDIPLCFVLRRVCSANLVVS